MHAIPQPLKSTRTKVLIVDDSALVRTLLTDIVNRYADMTVVGAARDPLIAREMIRERSPDVLLLDVEMPRMDGLDFLERLMRLRPMPVVMVSTLTEKGADVTLRALELGAIDFVEKPKIGISRGLADAGKEIVEKIRVAARANVTRRTVAESEPQTTVVRRDRPAKPRTFSGSTEKLIAIGASTGGTEALKKVLTGFPSDAPAILVVQHMPPGFTHSFAERLDEMCRIRVMEAQDGERVLPGHAYIAPGDYHMRLARSGADYVVRLSHEDPVSRHRPSVDVLFRSVAEQAGSNALGAILTGMGRDGASGMAEMHKAGAFTIAQDEKTCVIFGMPKEAIEAGGVDEVLPLLSISGRLMEKVGPSRVRNRV